MNDPDGSLAVNITGPLGKRKSLASQGSPAKIAKVRFDSDSSNSSAHGFLTPGVLGRSSVENNKVFGAVEAQQSQASGFGGAIRRLTSANVFSTANAFSTANTTSREREGGGRLSMWGEQLHDKLFAKKDMKEVMRGKLKFNLKDESNDNPQTFHADINGIIEYDEEDMQDIVKSNFASDFIESTAFRSFILSTIVINSVFIALQTEKELERKLGYLFSAMDQMILTIFICEILLKWYGGFFTYWKVGWNIFDFLIVASSLIGPSLTFISNSRILRILRVLRAFRSLRSISALRPLQLVVQTIIQSLPDMANILLLLVIFMFVFAVIGVSLFADYSPEYFGNLETAMFSLFICITLDGWIEIFNTLRNEQFPLASIYFVIFILIGAFILINLVVAVVVTNLESAIAEQDELDLQQMQEEKGNQDERDELCSYDLRDVIHKKFWKHQKPIEVPNLPALNPHKVQNYMILVTALEDNYSEMLFLKEELSKIAKEVWEWNSPVDDDDDDAEAPGVTTKAKKVLSEQEKKKEPHEKRDRLSTFASLLSRASIMTSDEIPPEPRKIKRKSTLSTTTTYIPLKRVVEEGATEEENVPERSGKEKARKDTGIGDPAPSHTIPIEVSVKLTDESESESESDEDEAGSASLLADVYADLPKSQPSFMSNVSVRKGSKSDRVAALRERRASLMDEMDRRDKRGDVLSDLIKMNKKTNNFSGKSENMTQFVHGVNWFKSKVKGGSDKPEKKRKWQVETELDRDKRGREYNPAARTSITSETLIRQHLSYIAAKSNSSLDLAEEEEILRTTSQMRRASLATTARQIEELDVAGAPETETDAELPQDGN